MTVKDSNPTHLQNNLTDRILEILGEIQVEFQDHKALILTESDLQNLLYMRLKPLFPSDEPTMNSYITGSALHSEVKFYNADGMLMLIPDLTIITPNNISILHSVEFKIIANRVRFAALPTKAFEFAGSGLTIIEIKFCRKKSGISDRDILLYQQDIEKIRQIQNISANANSGQNRINGIFAVFNKTDCGKELYENFAVRNRDLVDVRLFYGSGLVMFPRN